MAVIIPLNRWNLPLVERQCEDLGLELEQDFEFMWTEGIDSGRGIVFQDVGIAALWALKYSHLDL